MLPKVLSVAILGTGAACPSRESTTTGDTGAAASSGTTYELPSCRVTADQTECAAVAGCVWMPDAGCLVDCEQLDAMLTCETLDYCKWHEDDDLCVWAIA